MKRRAIPALLGLLTVLWVAAACDDAFGPARGQVHFVMAPRFAETDAGLSGDDPALRVDNIRVVIVNEAGDTVVDQIVEWPLDQDTLRVEVAIEVAGEELFDFTLQGREGNTVLFQAQQQVSLSSDDPAPAPAQPVLQYSGPEATLESVEIAGAPASFAAGAQIPLAAVGMAGDGSEVNDPLVIWSSLDTLAATVDSAGLVRVKHDASRTVTIVGRVAFRTLTDTVTGPVLPDTMVFVQAPDSITAFAADQHVEAIGLGVGGDTVRNLEIDWTVRDPSVIRNQALYDTGTQTVVRSVANGTSWLVGAAGSFVDSVLVTVHQITTAAAPVPTRALMGVGQTVQMAVVPLDANGFTVENSPAVLWTSSLPTVASVDTAGLVMGQSAPSEITAVRVTGDIDGESYNAWMQVRDDINVGAPDDLSVGDGHSCFIEGIRTWIYCRGVGEFGQLGDGFRIDRDTTVLAFNSAQGPGDTHTQVATGGLHTCALMDTVGGTQAFCWGDNRFGQLGDGTTIDQLESTPVSDGSVTGAIASLTAGGGHTCALTGAGAAWCWGSNYFGQLGNGDTADSESTPIAVIGGHTFTALAAGWTHTCGLEADGTIWCWGRGEEGQLGDGVATEAHAPVQVSGGQTFTNLVAGAAHTCGITTGGGLECWGYNSAGQAGVGDQAFFVTTPMAVTFPTAITVVDVALGWIHGCALSAAGDVYCWGGNSFLQLAQAEPRVTRVPVAIPALGFVPSDLSGGGNETCATDGSVIVCWGGIDPSYLGRDEVVIPVSGDPVTALLRR